MTNPPNAQSRLRRFVDRMPLDAKKPRQFALISFLECTFIPMPLEVITAPFMIAYPRRAIVMSIYMWVACMIGAILFYFLGWALYEPLVMPTLEMLGLTQKFEAISSRFSDQGLFWTVLTAAILPVPLQLATLSAGVMQGNFFVFILAIGLARAGRYIGLAVLCRFLGNHVERIFTNRWFVPVLVTVCVVAVWLLYKFVWT